jgi:hypothetical protein
MAPHTFVERRQFSETRLIGHGQASGPRGNASFGQNLHAIGLNPTRKDFQPDWFAGI